MGKIVTALAEKDILNNTIVVFVADNGGISVGNCKENNYSVNLPLRGLKQTPWEGAVRVPAIIWHSLFQPAVWNGLFHVTDWFPTLLSAGGGIPADNLDGINHWKSITHRKPSNRKEFLITIDNINGFAAYKYGHYKLVVGHNLNDIGSGFHGGDFLAQSTSERDYESILMNCEIASVISKISNRPMNMSLVLRKRNSTLLHREGPIIQNNLCKPTLCTYLIFIFYFNTK